MSRIMRFAVALVLGLGVLTWVASIVVQKTTRAWFEHDLVLRSELAVNGAREALIEGWEQDPQRLRSVLSEIARDERILAVAACTAGLEMLARTASYDAEQLACKRIGSRVRVGTGDASWTPWHGVESLRGIRVHVSALPVWSDSRGVGFVVLVHDLSFVENRETQARDFVLLAFGFLTAAASAVTLVRRARARSAALPLRVPAAGHARRPAGEPARHRRLLSRRRLQ